MCTYLAKRGATYYFRRPIPVKLRPFLDGHTQFMESLGTKDRETAKQMIPDFTKASDEALNAARAELAKQSPAGQKPRSIIPPGVVDLITRAQEADALVAKEKAEQQERRAKRSHFVELWARRLALSTKELEPEEAALKDLIESGRFSTAQAQAGLDQMEQQVTAAEAERRSGRGEVIYLSSIVDKWGAERKVQKKGIDAHKAVARWFEERVGKVALGDITRQHVLRFKDKLAEDGLLPVWRTPR